MRRPARGVLLQGFVAAVVVLLAVSPADEMVHDLVFRHVVSHETRLAANGVTLLGTTAVGIAIVGGLAGAGYRAGSALMWRAGIGGLAGLAIGGLGVQAVKHVACRARPRLVEGWGVGAPGVHDATVPRGFLHWPCWSGRQYDGFPSGHATTAFTVAASLAAWAPVHRRTWLAAAALVGASRIVLNAHFLSDVLAGGLLGWWAGMVGLRLAARHLRGPGPAPAVLAASMDERGAVAAGRGGAPEGRGAPPS